ncbi:MAG TPA: RNA polymerase sigma factor [Patescibacteria group bacterium]
MKDEELVYKIQNGEKELYGEIMERYEGKLFGYIKHLVNQEPEEVEDLVEEVFISGYINLQSFDSKKRFSSWIYRIAHNKAIDYFKKKKTYTKGLTEDNEELLPNEEKLTEELQIEEERKMKIKEAIDKLEVKYREAIILNYFEEKSYDEISDILHIPVSHVGVILFRAKKILKEKLKDIN